MFVSFKFRKTFCFLVVTSLIISIVAAAFTSKVMAQSTEGIKVPIIMYHSILKDESKWGDYVLSPAQLEKDIIYLKENGYTSVFVQDLIEYVKFGTPLPEKPVIISFDDGDYNNLTYVLPLLEEYDFKATISVVGKFAEIGGEDAKPSPSYSSLDFKDIKELYESGFVEIANHSYDMHSLDTRKGASMIDGEDYETYRRDFLNDTFKTQNLLQENCRFKPTVYTYPYGFTCDATRNLVKSCGFNASLGVEEEINYIVEGDDECLYDLHRYNRPSSIKTEDFMIKALAD